MTHIDLTVTENKELERRQCEL